MSIDNSKIQDNSLSTEKSIDINNNNDEIISKVETKVESNNDNDTNTNSNNNNNDNTTNEKEQKKDNNENNENNEQSNTDNSSNNERQDIIPDRIFVGNLPYEVTEDDVRNLTPEFEVVSVEIPRKDFFDRSINKIVLQSKGYGFITYTNPEDAKLAIDSIVGKSISGREIYAKYALPQNKNRLKNQFQNNNNNNNNNSNSNNHPYSNNYKKNGFYPINNNNNNNNNNFNPHFHNIRNIPPNGHPNFYYPPLPPPVQLNPNNNNYYTPNSPQSSNINGGIFKPNPQVASFFPTNLNNRNIKPFYPTPINGQSIQLSQRNFNNQFYPRSKEEKQKRLEKGIPSKTTIFIGNLDRNVTVDDLRNYMKDLNPEWIKVPRKTLPNEIYRMLKSNGVQIQNKGIAFVRFENEENQKKAIELFNGNEWNGKKLNVTIAINSNDEINSNIIGENVNNNECIEGDLQQSVKIKIEGTPNQINDAVNDIVETAIEQEEAKEEYNEEEDEEEEDDDVEIEVNVSE